MATYTSSLGLELITPGSQAGLWGNTTNNTFTLLDQAVTGVTPVSFSAVSGTTYTLTDYNGAADEARSAVINVTGTATGSNTIVIPNKQKTYLVRNNTGQDIVFKTAGSGATYTVEAGNSILVFCDGNNNVYTGIQSPNTGTLSVSGGGTGATTFTAGFLKSAGGTTALSTVSGVDLSTEVGSSILPVANGGTGVATIPSGAFVVGNGTGNVASLSGTVSGQIATWNGSTWVASSPSASGVSSFNSRTGAVTLASSDITGALGYVPVSTSNSNTWSAINYFGPVSGGLPIRVNGGAGQTLSIGGASVTTTNSEFNVYASTSTQALAVRTTGTYNVNGVYGTISDVRVKENIVQAPNYLDNLNKVNVVKYSLKEENSPVPTKLGVIAQELEQIFPGLIDNTDPDNKSVKMSIFIPMLVKSVQELTAKLDEANARIAALEAK